MLFRLSFLVLLCSIIVNSAHIPQYKGYKVYEIIPKDELQIQFLRELAKSDANVDFWKMSREAGVPTRVMVPPHHQNDFEQILKENEIEFLIISTDVFKSLQENQNPTSLFRSIRSITGRADFSRFLRFDEINAYMDTLALKYPKTVKVETVGQSYEGRKLKTITISNGDSNQTEGKKVIFIDGGIHASEWIAPAMSVYLIYQLTENSQANADLLKNFDWKILPVVNPDGYEYTHSGDRFWRKTRKPNKLCVGTDLNRNFDFHWAEVGTSNSSCHLTYHGSGPFSEPEARIVRDILLSLKGRGKMYITLHSYGNYLLYPWGWTSALPATWKDIDEVARAGATAIYRATGSKYKVGSSTNVLYAAAGGSDDYAFAKADFPIAMTMELPPGGSGFDPHPSQILPMVKETWIGIKAMAKKVDEKYA